MKNKIFNFSIGLLLGSLIVFFSVNEGWHCRPDNSVVSTQIDTTSYFIHDTIHSVYYQKIKVNKIDTLTLFDTIWMSEHCDSIMMDWTAERYFIDTLKDDSNAFISITSVVWRNNLEDLTLEFKNRKPTQIITNNFTNEKKRKFNFLLGATLQRTSQGEFDIFANGGGMFGDVIILGGIGFTGANVSLVKKIK